MSQIRLDDPDRLLDALTTGSRGKYTSDSDYGNLGSIYCPKCAQESVVHVTLTSFHGTVGQPILSKRAGVFIAGKQTGIYDHPENPTDPSLFTYRCVNCNTEFYALLYGTEQSLKLAIISSYLGGLSSPATPAEVRYFVDQAYRAQMASAYSAAMTMYRTALDQILEDQGYGGKLPSKITQLENDVNSGSGKEWARNVVPEILKTIKEIADSESHSNDSPSSVLHAEFMQAVQKTFIYLLADIYENKSKRELAKNRLKTALDSAKKLP